MIDLDSEFERACSKPHEGASFDALSQRDKILIAIWGLGRIRGRRSVFTSITNQDSYFLCRIAVSVPCFLLFLVSRAWPGLAPTPETGRWSTALLG